MDMTLRGPDSTSPRVLVVTKGADVEREVLTTLRGSAVEADGTGPELEVVRASDTASVEWDIDCVVAVHDPPRVDDLETVGEVHEGRPGRCRSWSWCRRISTPARAPPGCRRPGRLHFGVRPRGRRPRDGRRGTRRQRGSIQPRPDGRGDRRAVRVRDDGEGVPEHERAITQLDHGQGLGLWLAKWVVGSYGVELDIEVDEGTAVTPSLPRGD